MQSFGCRPDELSQVVIEHDLLATARLAVEDRSVGYADLQHPLQAHGLSTKLYAVGVVGFGATSFVFHWQGAPSALGLWEGNTAALHAMELHDIGNTAQAEGKRVEPQAADNPQVTSRFIRDLMDAFMQEPAFRCETVLGPGVLEVDEGALPLAEKQVLKGREWEEVGLIVLGTFVLVGACHSQGMLSHVVSAALCLERVDVRKWSSRA